MVRSRDQQNAEEEMASLYHHRKACKGSLDKLNVTEDSRSGYHHNVNIVTTGDLRKIKLETVAFMESLRNGWQDEHLQDTGETFIADNTHLEEFLSTLSQLSEASQESLVRPLREDEVKDVLKSCANGKTPGLDGITYEFYKRT